MWVAVSGVGEAVVRCGAMGLGKVRCGCGCIGVCTLYPFGI